MTVANLSTRSGLESCSPHRMGGTHWIYRFANDLGASITDCRIVTNGADYELAVFAYNGKRCDIVYDTGITTDVERGSLNDMLSLLDQIEALPPRAR